MPAIRVPRSVSRRSKLTSIMVMFRLNRSSQWLSAQLSAWKTMSTIASATNETSTRRNGLLFSVPMASPGRPRGA
jgi:hypothetical protein